MTKVWLKFTLKQCSLLVKSRMVGQSLDERLVSAIPLNVCSTQLSRFVYKHASFYNT